MLTFIYILCCLGAFYRFNCFQSTGLIDIIATSTFKNLLYQYKMNYWMFLYTKYFCKCYCERVIKVIFLWHSHLHYYKFTIRCQYDSRAFSKKSDEMCALVKTRLSFNNNQIKEHFYLVGKGLTPVLRVGGWKEIRES